MTQPALAGYARAMIKHAALALVVLVSCRPLSDAPVSCASDKDCNPAPCGPCGAGTPITRAMMQQECVVNPCSETSAVCSVHACVVKSSPASAVASTLPTASEITSAAPLDANACTTDADCVVATFADCCACCGRVPYGTNKRALDQRMVPCARVHCAPVTNCECKPTEPAENFRAVCTNAACAAVHK